MDASDPGDVIARAFQTNDLEALEKRTKMLRVLQGLMIENLEIHHMNADGSDAIMSSHAIHDVFLEGYEITGVGGPFLGLAVTTIVKEPGVETEEAKFVRRVYDFHQLFPTGDWKTILDEDSASSVASGSTDLYSTSVEESGEEEEDEVKEKQERDGKKPKKHKKENAAVEKHGDGDGDGVGGDDGDGGDIVDELLHQSGIDEPQGSSQESKSDDSLQRIFDARDEIAKKKKNNRKRRK